MEKFEYKNEVVQCPEYSPLVTDVCNKLGASGWEVVGIFGVDRDETDEEWRRRDLYMSEYYNRDASKREKVRETRLILKRKVPELPSFPPPPELTPELLEEIRKYEESWSKAFREQTKQMEGLSPEDLRILVGSTK